MTRVSYCTALLHVWIAATAAGVLVGAGAAQSAFLAALVLLVLAGSSNGP